MLPALGTHFNAAIGIATLEQIRAFGFRVGRVDAQLADQLTIATMLDECHAVGLAPLPIVFDLERLRLIPAGVDVEWGNEPDGDIRPSVYRDGLEAACDLARELGLALWGPAISNLDRDSLGWLEAVRGDGWPAGLYGITVHRYGDGSFDYSHPGFEDRGDEVEALRQLLDGLPYMVTEFGYPTAAGGRRGRLNQTPCSTETTVAELEAAVNIGKEWRFWRAQDCRAAFLYQINDGPHEGESYGIRRCLPDGTLTDWKPAAYHVPKT